MAFRKAQRRKAKLRLAITGTAGSGKTYGALLIAFGLGGKIAMIDTENGSGDLYSNLGDYDVYTLSAPYKPDSYISLIHEAEQSGYNTVIIDSLSHAWNGEGGLLDFHTQIVSSMKSGNSYVAWGKVTPLQNQLVDCILASPCHIIATMRSKTEYVQKNDNGHTEIHKVGLAPVQRDGIDYEFTTVFDTNNDHITVVSKDRTGIFGDKPFRVTPKVGEALRKWLDAGVEMQRGGEA